MINTRYYSVTTAEGTRSIKLIIMKDVFEISTNGTDYKEIKCLPDVGFGLPLKSTDHVFLGVFHVFQDCEGGQLMLEVVDPPELVKGNSYQFQMRGV